MKASSIAMAAAGAATLSLASAALAEDNEAGVPLTPAEAAGAWTVSSNGKDLCTLTLGAQHTVEAAASCAGVLPGNPTSWRPTKDGMQLVGGDGQGGLAFHRWSNSLFVSHRTSGVDIQLRRGGQAG
jgi:hypothetical protein